MIKTIKYIPLLLLLISCKNNNIEKPKKPDNLIAKDKMVDIIYDISLINSAKGINKKLMENKGINPKDYIFKKHSIDSLQFALSNEYYTFNLVTYEDIYNSVMVKLERDKKYFDSITRAEKIVKDSINKKTRREFDSLKKLGKTNKILKRKGDSIFLSPLKKIDTSQISTDQ